MLVRVCSQLMFFLYVQALEKARSLVCILCYTSAAGGCTTPAPYLALPHPLLCAAADTGSSGGGHAARAAVAQGGGEHA